MEYYVKLGKEFGIKEDYARNIIALIDEGNTIPFIARYRKEKTGSCDDQVLREFSDRLNYLRNLDKRKSEVASSIDEQGKWTAEIALALEKAQTLTEVEDIYRPYVKKRKTRATVAMEKGLEPVADFIQAGTGAQSELDALCDSLIGDEDGKAKSKDEAISGALDIIAERVSDNAELRKALRALLVESGKIATKLDEEKENAKTYDMYKDKDESIKSIPSHRILAVNRGEKEECLSVSLVLDVETAIAKIYEITALGGNFAELIDKAVRDSYKRLIFPSIEREIRNELTDRASEQAIKMFEVNLRPYLMQPPLKSKRILGLDPAYRTGCKIAVIDESGNVLDTTVVYPTPPTTDAKIEEAKKKLVALILKHRVDVISIGNGTASKESEIFVAGMIKEYNLDVTYAVVNEAGASVYSASKLGAEEFPEFDVSLRSAVSIARRLQDPLAELIKIDVKSIGVGQYQHDMPEKRLDEVLGGVVEDCVNSVGVDLNTASESLLSYVAGVGKSIAKNIVEYRKSKPFTSRDELLKVKKLGDKAYEQCAGFLRVPGGVNVLDNTAVHPEDYEAVKTLLTCTGYTMEDVQKGTINDIKKRIQDMGASVVAQKCNIGEPTLIDIVEELLKPGRDIRDTLPPPVLRSDLMDLKDLKDGMEIEGTVRNVIDFGVFVDIGVHQDGLVHISEISNNFVSHPSDVLKVGDKVKVRVLGVDQVKKKISLSLKTQDNPNGIGGIQKTDRQRKEGRLNAQKERANRPAPKKEASLDDMLKNLAGKFNKR
ncbi:MAG: RNA-binding transcriptional accessory protein [Clostridia bacterium]|nr:RNA-binding transcriptional accessory protein [Clostridia bacterium]